MRLVENKMFAFVRTLCNHVFESHVHLARHRSGWRTKHEHGKSVKLAFLPLDSIYHSQLSSFSISNHLPLSINMNIFHSSWPKLNEKNNMNSTEIGSNCEMIIEKFTEANFHVWKQKSASILTYRGVDDVVGESDPHRAGNPTRFIVPKGQAFECNYWPVIVRCYCCTYPRKKLGKPMTECISNNFQSHILLNKLSASR